MPGGTHGWNPGWTAAESEEGKGEKGHLSQRIRGIDCSLC